MSWFIHSIIWISLWTHSHKYIGTATSTKMMVSSQNSMLEPLSNVRNKTLASVCLDVLHRHYKFILNLRKWSFRRSHFNCTFPKLPRRYGNIFMWPWGFHRFIDVCWYTINYAFKLYKFVNIHETISILNKMNISNTSKNFLMTLDFKDNYTLSWLL